jgi:hypothetical protein
MSARFWQDEDGVDKVSNAIRELVDGTAKEAVEEFITGDEIWVRFSADDTTVRVASIGDHAPVHSKGESILDLLNDVIELIEDSEEPVDSPYPAMRDAYLKWQQGVLAEQKDSETA